MYFQSFREQTCIYWPLINDLGFWSSHSDVPQKFLWSLLKIPMLGIPFTHLVRKIPEILLSVSAHGQRQPSSQPLATLAMCITKLGHNAGMPGAGGKWKLLF